MIASRYRPTLFATLAVSYTMVFVQGVVLTVSAKDIMRELELSPEGMGVLGSAYFYVYAGVILFSGLLAAWLGPRRTLSVTFLVSGAGCLLFAVSGSFHAAFAGRGLTAVGMAATMTSSFTLFNRWYPSESYARLCSWFFAIGGVGAFGGIFLSSIANEAWGWRGLFMALAALTVFFALCCHAIVRDWPGEGATVGTAAVGKDDYRLSKLLGGLRQVVARMDFWKVWVWFACLTGSYFAIVGLWGIPYLEDVYRISSPRAGSVVAMAGLGFVVGTPILSWLFTDVFKSLRAGMGLAGAFAAVSVSLLVATIDSLPHPALYAVMFLFGLVLNAPSVLGYACARNLFGPSLAGVTAGAMGCAVFLGGAFQQTLCGAILKYTLGNGWPPASAYSLAFAPLIVFGCVAAVCAFTVSRASFPGNLCGKTPTNDSFG